jgi:hypothetical protein
MQYFTLSASIFCLNIFFIKFGIRIHAKSSEMSNAPKNLTHSHSHSHSVQNF